MGEQESIGWTPFGRRVGDPLVVTRAGVGMKEVVRNLAGVCICRRQKFPLIPE